MPIIDFESRDVNIETIYKLCNLDDKSLFIDLGANHGQQIGLLCEKNIETIAFEPHPVIFDKLVENHVKKENKKLTCYKKAAWIRNETKNLYYKNGPNKINGGASLIFEKTNVTHSDPFVIECVDFAEFLHDLNRTVDVLKIDVEGSEYHLIEHLIENNAIKFIKNIFVEDHERKIQKNSKFYNDYVEKRALIHSFFKRSSINYCNWK